MNRILEEDLGYVLSDNNIDWNKYCGKTFLISGASGALASYMAKTLLYFNKKISNPIRIIALVRNINRAKQQYSEFLPDSNLIFLEQDVIYPVVTYSENIDYIIHAASPASPKLFFSDPVGTINANTLGTHNLLCLAKEKNIKSFLFFSSGEVYGNIFERKNLVNENDYGIINPLDVRNCYAESKKLGENMCYCWFQQFGIPIKIVRPAHTYGPGFKADDGRAFSSFVNSIAKGEDIILKSDGSAKRSFIYLADAVRAYFLILQKGKNGEAYNVGNDKEISIKELAELLISLNGNKQKIIYDIPKDSPSSKSSHGQLDISKIKQLGWQPVISEKEGFDRTLKYLTDNLRSFDNDEKNLYLV